MLLSCCSYLVSHGANQLQSIEYLVRYRLLNIIKTKQLCSFVGLAAEPRDQFGAGGLEAKKSTGAAPHSTRAYHCMQEVDLPCARGHSVPTRLARGIRIWRLLESYDTPS